MTSRLHLRKYCSNWILVLKASDHTYKRKRVLIQDTKKVDCPAVIIVREILAFPNFKVSTAFFLILHFVVCLCPSLHYMTLRQSPWLQLILSSDCFTLSVNSTFFSVSCASLTSSWKLLLYAHCFCLHKIDSPTEWKMKATSSKIRSLLCAPAEDDATFGEWRYYVQLPNENVHKNHMTNENGPEVISFLLFFFQRLATEFIFLMFVSAWPHWSYFLFLVVMRQCWNRMHVWRRKSFDRHCRVWNAARTRSEVSERQVECAYWCSSYNCVAKFVEQLLRKPEVSDDRLYETLIETFYVTTLMHEQETQLD